MFIVIAIVIEIAVLSTVILRVITSHATLTHHQVSRIQAQYAAKAGMVYALEMLRKGTAAGGWAYSPINSCPDPGGCLVADPSFPTPIVSKQVRVIFCPAGVTCQFTSSPCNPPASYNFCVNSTADFTYVP
jgi:hypothetical protein